MEMEKFKHSAITILLILTIIGFPTFLAEILIPIAKDKTEMDDGKPISANPDIYAEFLSGTPPLLDGDLSDAYWSGGWDVSNYNTRQIYIKTKHDKHNLYFALQWTDNDVWGNNIGLYFEDDGTAPDRNLDSINEDHKYAGASFGTGTNRNFADAWWSSGWTVGFEFPPDGMYGAQNVGNIWYVEASVPLSTGSVYDIDVTSPEVLGFMFESDYAWEPGTFPIGGGPFDASTWDYLHVLGPFNAVPNAPTNPTPSNGASDVSTDPALSVDVVDSDGDSMDVSFYNDSDDSLIGIDFSVASGGTASVSWADLSTNTVYSWYAVVDDGDSITTSSTWSFTTHHSPNVPTNPNPINDAIGVSLKPTLSVDVSHTQGTLMNVFFIDDVTKNLIGADLGVASGTTASVVWSGLLESTSYSWYAYADDGIWNSTSPIWNFTTNYPPGLPSNPNPSNGATSVGPNPILSVDVTDLEGDSMDVYFYNASDDGLINIDSGVTSGGTASSPWLGISGGMLHSWYVIANDGKTNTTSLTWSFTRNSAPNAPINPSPTDSATGVSTASILSVDVSDLEGDSMDVYFYNASDDSLIDTDIGVVSGGTASVSWSGLSESTINMWYVVVDDGKETITSPTWSFTTNYAPNMPTNPSPINSATGIIVSPTLKVDVSDFEGDLIDVYFCDASDDSLIGSDLGVISGGTASVSWHGLLEGTIYSWYVVSDDRRGYITSPTWSFTTGYDLPIWDEIPSNKTIRDGETFIYDLNATDSSGIDNWWINNTINFQIDSSGKVTNVTSLLIGTYELIVRAYDPYGQYCEAHFKISVVVTQLPNWNQIPSDQIVEFGNLLSYIVNASSIYGIDSWWVNDTIKFNIDGNGVITNLIPLLVGENWLEIFAYDPYGSNCSAIIKIIVIDTTPPSISPEITATQILEYGNIYIFDINASDLSGIDHWWINDSIDFIINDIGVITTKNPLSLGDYQLEVRVYDIYNNFESSSFLIQVEDTIEPIITVLAPKDDQSFGKYSPVYSITVEDDSIEEYGLQNIWYSVNLDLTAYVITDMVGFIDEELWESFAEGFLMLHFFVIDTSGNQGYAQVRVYKEPQINSPSDSLTLIPGYNLMIIGLISLISIIFSILRRITHFYTIKNKYE